MMRRTLAVLGVLGLAFVLTARAAETTAKKEDTPEKKSADIKDRLTLKQQILTKRFEDFKAALLRVKQRLEKGTQEDKDKAKALENALKHIDETNLDTKFKQLVAVLGSKEKPLNDPNNVHEAMEQSRKLAEEIRQLLNILREDNRAAKLRDERKRLEEMIRELEGIIKDQKIVRAKTAMDKMDKGDLARGQKNVSDRTAELERKLGGKGKDTKGKAGKDDRGEAKGKGKGEGKEGQGKGEGKDQKGEGKQGDKGGKGGQKGNKGNPDDKNPKGGEKGKGKDGGKESKGGQGKEKGAGKKGGEPKSGASKGKGGEKGKPNGDPKAGKPSQGKGQGKDQKGESKSQGKGGDSKSGDSKAGDKKSSPSKSGDSKSGSKSGGKPSQGSPNADPNSDPNSKKNDQPQDDTAHARKQIQDAEQHQKKAEEKIARDDKKKAGDSQDKAIDELEKAKKKLEELLRQTREEELERLLTALENRCRQMLEMQRQVKVGTVEIHKVVLGNKDKKPDRTNDQDSGRLAEKEKAIVIEATKAIEMIEAEGSAVAFAEVFKQVRTDMEEVQKLLEKTQVGIPTQEIEQDIIDTLEEMIKALQKAKQQMQPPPPNQPNPSPPPPPQDQKLLDQIAELKMIRSMQIKVNKRTRLYGNEYVAKEGEQTSDATLKGKLKDLSERQEKLFDVTMKIVKGENK